MTANDMAKAVMAKKAEAKVEDPVTSLARVVMGTQMEKQLTMALPIHLKENAGRYMRSYLTQIRTNPALINCSKPSLLGAMMTGAALGLDPSPSLGEFYLVPYKDECTFIMGYKGMIDLAYRGSVQKIWGHEVCKNDDFGVVWGDEERLIHKPDFTKDRGEVIGYYVCAILPSGKTISQFMTKEQVTAHGKKYSKTFNFGPWKTQFDDMALKTCVRKLARWLPKSTELAIALSRDEGVIEADTTKEVADSEDVYEMEVKHFDPAKEGPEVIEVKGE